MGLLENVLSHLTAPLAIVGYVLVFLLVGYFVLMKWLVGFKLDFSEVSGEYETKCKDLPLLFVSLSGDSTKSWWSISEAVVKTLASLFDGQYFVASQRTFRFDDFLTSPSENWARMYQYTRQSHAMIVFLHPDVWTSDGQQDEVTDALGRGMPIALCKLTELRDEEHWINIYSPEGSIQKHRCVFTFDLHNEFLKAQELRRLKNWVMVFALPPVSLPASFRVNVSREFRTCIHIPSNNVWDRVDWKFAFREPRLVFHYGTPRLVSYKYLVYYERILSQEQKEQQIIVPLSVGAVRGELNGRIRLTAAGSGNVHLQANDSHTGAIVSFRDWEFEVY